MDKMNLGFIGGCINRQAGIQRSDLYYSVLTHLLDEQVHAEEHQASLATYLSFDRLLGITGQLIMEKKPDIIFLFIRPFALMPLQKPLVRFDREKGRKGMALHPALFSRKLNWNERFSRWQVYGEYSFVRKKRFGFRDLNLLAGLLAGLDRWSMRYVIRQLQEVKKLCDEKNIILCIISPPGKQNTVLAEFSCRRATLHLEKYCLRNHLNFIDISSFSADFYESDLVHLNAAGHKKLAETLFIEFSRPDFRRTAGMKPEPRKP
jgi:hypothetical protein